MIPSVEILGATEKITGKHCFHWRQKICISNHFTNEMLAKYLETPKYSDTQMPCSVSGVYTAKVQFKGH